jgi:hypothetical protein
VTALIPFAYSGSIKACGDQVHVQVPVEGVGNKVNRTSAKAKGTTLP